MKILVLGSSGFLGRNAADYFAAKGHKVIRHGFRRAGYSYPDEPWVTADLREPGKVDYAGFDVVIQTAAASSGCKDTLEDPAMHIATNGVMNSYILKECAKAGVGHVIFPSCSVMFASSPIAQKELDWDASAELNAAYLGFASTKIFCEQLCRFYASISDTKFTVMRNTNYFGPFDKFDLNHSHVFGATITKVMRATDKITVWGTGEEARDFLYVEDFCRFAELAIEKQTTRYALYNVGSGVAVQIRDLVAKVVAASGKNLTIEYDTSKPTIPTSLCLDSTKAREELGWEPSVSLEDGIVGTLKWWGENYS